MRSPLYVSFFTPDYAPAAKTLVSSLRQFGLEHMVEAAADLGSWQKNTQWKAKFIWEKLTTAGRPVVWLDADCVVNAQPELFDTIVADVSVCKVRRQGREEGLETLSGTVYFKGSPASIRVVDQWIEVCGENPEHWDQRCLEIALERVPEAKVELLPVSYCYIHDTHRKMYPKLHPVIEHFQWSRRHRK